MTERDFYLLCYGHEQRELKSAKELRMLMYTIVCGYADPKKLPPIHRWMPLDGDDVPTVSAERMKELIDKFNSFKSWKARPTVN